MKKKPEIFDGVIIGVSYMMDYSELPVEHNMVILVRRVVDMKLEAAEVYTIKASSFYNRYHERKVRYLDKVTNQDISHLYQEIITNIRRGQPYQIHHRNKLVVHMEEAKP